MSQISKGSRSFSKPTQRPRQMNFVLPQTFCEFYKFLLVDELALCDNPALIHYGYCSVIGILSTCDSLGSLTIPNLDKCYQLPDNLLKVQLLMDCNPASYLNMSVEVFGEVRLYDRQLDGQPEERHLESAHSLIQKLGSYQQYLEEQQGLPARPPSGTNDKGMHHLVKSRLQKKIEDFKKQYKPIIRVHTIRHISEAREIIAENLHFRQIQSLRKNRLKS